MVSLNKITLLILTYNDERQRSAGVRGGASARGVVVN